MGAAAGQVLKWTTAGWAPQDDCGCTGAAAPGQAGVEGSVAELWNAVDSLRAENDQLRAKVAELDAQLSAMK